jgi:hypothetical protein
MLRVTGQEHSSVTSDRPVLMLLVQLTIYVAAVALSSERLHAVLKKGDYVGLAQSRHYADIEITVLSVP